MASVTERLKVVKEGYTLELSEAEADALICVLRFVGGPPRSRRGLIDSILMPLKKAVGKWNDTDVRGSISFE